MNRYLTAAILLLVVTPAAAVTPTDAARFAVRYTAIGTTCSEMMRVDKEAAKRESMIGYRVLARMVGDSEFGRLTQAETTRTMNTMRAYGIDVWCRQQKWDPDVAGTGVFTD